MKIYKLTNFSWEDYMPAIDWVNSVRGGSTYNHYTNTEIANNLLKLMNNNAKPSRLHSYDWTGLGRYQATDGREVELPVSTYKGNEDFLLGQNISELKDEAASALKARGINSKDDIESKGMKRVRILPDPLSVFAPGHQDARRDDPRFEPYYGIRPDLRDPVASLSSIDNVAGSIDLFDPATRVEGNRLYNDTIVRLGLDPKADNKTNESIIKDGDNNEYKILSSDTGKNRIASITIPAQKPVHSKFTRKLRKLMKTNKNVVPATRENMEFIYGNKYPHLHKFPSEVAAKVVDRSSPNVKHIFPD
jgi:hypothetical protein